MGGARRNRITSTLGTGHKFNLSGGLASWARGRRGLVAQTPEFWKERLLSLCSIGNPCHSGQKGPPKQGC